MSKGYHNTATGVLLEDFRPSIPFRSHRTNRIHFGPSLTGPFLSPSPSRSTLASESSLFKRPLKDLGVFIVTFVHDGEVLRFMHLSGT